MMKYTQVFIFSILMVLCFDSCKNEDSPVPSKLRPIDFGPSTFGSMEDRQGNSYKTIQIGADTWMAENLRVNVTREGDELNSWQDASSWLSTTTPAYFSYRDDVNDIGLYGFLYNEHAKDLVCPEGWRIPDRSDWESLTNELGGARVAGGNMKEEGTAHWISPNTGANNSKGFSGMPGGSLFRGNLNDKGRDGYWWSAEKGKFYYASSSRAEIRTMSGAPSTEGLSIRCIKN